MSFSIRNLFRHRSAQVPASRGDRKLAQKLVDRGIAAEASRNAAAALQHYRNAVEVDATFAPAHMNLGIALQAAGDLDAAIASFVQAIAVDSEYAAAHYNLALAYFLRSQFSDAETSFRNALQFRADFPEAWVGLASVFEALHRDEDALSALDKAIALRGDYAGALLNSSVLLRKMGRLETAVANGRLALELEPENYVAQYVLGANLQDLGRLSEAEPRYRQALALEPDYREAKTALAMLLEAKGRTQESIPLLFEVVASEPTSIQLRRILVNALKGVELIRPRESERSILLSLCMDDDVSMQFLEKAIVASIKNSEGFQLLQKSARGGDDPFTSIVPPVAAFLREPLLLTALPRMWIGDAAMEEVLAHMRRCILLRFRGVSGLAAADPNVPMEFMAALARQCFFSGYASFADEHEHRLVSSLRAALQDTLHEARPNLRTLESSLTVASLYDSLHTLKGSERLLEHPMADWSDAFRPIVQEQIENRKREREIAMQLTAITTIDDEISLLVGAQYEENPYPRWVTVPSPGADTIEDLSRRLRPGYEVRVRPRPVPILVAGCGTGHHPIQVARAYPDSEILAVDLSVASLGYAVRMTERFAVSNITYRQADILKLGNLDLRFAIVECSGVLHHLDNPMAGWRVLVNLLESDGLMKIGLYSEKARSAVRAARDFARSLNFPLTSEGVRQCRHAIMRLPEGHPAKGVMTFGDFFTLDGCRDLMMHVQEHQFTLPRIADCLNQLGLQFLALECATTTRSRFREMFPDSDADTNLNAWHRFEEAYPETFKNMYSFWCCRK